MSQPIKNWEIKCKEGEGYYSAKLYILNLTDKELSNVKVTHKCHNQKRTASVEKLKPRELSEVTEICTQKGHADKYDISFDGIRYANDLQADLPNDEDGRALVVIFQHTPSQVQLDVVTNRREKFNPGSSVDYGLSG